ncbi:MAG: thioredoxin family protein [Legionellaceae bacterium]|nr:thioredoxin family protein [Legionellaceae bacterium]
MGTGANVQNIKSGNFEKLIKENEIVFVDFWANWCVPCKNFAPIYEEASKLYPSIVFAQVDVEKEQELSDIFEIRSVPHLMVFKKGIAIYSESGIMPESTLKELAQQAINADVSEIVAQIDEQQDS